ncbi:MAG: carbohydrate ABC transporter permease [Lachnospiraceae bacterium]|nr:carbohydrate ABC transporter permease [Lachnospiraceae bacterium]
MKKKSGIWRLPILLVIFGVYFSPFYILAVISFKPVTDLSSRWKFSSAPTLENFQTAIEQGGILQALMHSFVIMVVTVVLIVLVGSLAAYPLARNQSKWNKVIRAFVLGIMMVPPLSILVSLYSIIVKMGGVNQYWGIILVLLTFELPQAIFLYSNFISSIPTALDEAAALDGCGPVRTFFLIIFPQLKSVTASVVILAGIHCWNDYQFSLYVLQSSGMRTVTLAISSFFSQTTSNLNAASAAALLAILPVVVCFLFLQKYFIKGMVDSAVK